jgi:outer membrane protein
MKERAARVSRPTVIPRILFVLPGGPRTARTEALVPEVSHMQLQPRPGPRGRPRLRSPWRLPSPLRLAPAALAALAALALAALGPACAPPPPGVYGVPATAPAPSQRWSPPARALADTSLAAQPPSKAVPPELLGRLQRLTLGDAIDVALRNNPATRLAWANARAAAAGYASARGSYLPTLDLSVTATTLKTVATQGRSAVRQTVYSPGATLSWLLFDLGGRSGTVEAARQALIAADFTHNATLQDLVLQVAQAYFGYLANEGLLDARRASLREAEGNLAAAQERHRVGLATIADVLQARTALSQAQLDAQTTEGSLLTARGALALSLGLPADVTYEVDSTSHAAVAPVADSVEALVARAVRNRPDLAAARAQVHEALARVRSARAQRLPSLAVDGAAERTYSTRIPNGDYAYNVSLGLRIPFFSGFSREYAQEQAEAQAEAVAAQAEGIERQVVYEVFSSYYALQTATRRVRTADELLAGAEQSAAVALGRYRAGVGSILDLLAAQSALASARGQRIEARLAWNTSLAQLAHDAGVLDLRGESNLPLVPDSTAPSGLVPGDSAAAPAAGPLPSAGRVDADSGPIGPAALPEDTASARGSP